jgi:hypothetical protein
MTDPNANPPKHEPVTLVVKGDTVEETSTPSTALSGARLRDGRVVSAATVDGDYELTSPAGHVQKGKFTYTGDGAGVFIVSNGPLGRIYGGSYMPCQIFWYDPATGATENPGNPCEVGGEIYSMLDHHGSLYVCGYPGSFLSKWDPSKPWDYGREPGKNPQGFGPLGPGHLRPRAMVQGPEERLYIGSYPEYGKHGGAVAVWDPAQDKLIDNFQNLIKNQAIASLVYDAKTGLVFGGSSTAGGGGTTPIEKEAKFFAFDPAAKSLVLEEAPFEGVQDIRTLVLAGRRIFGIAGDNRLFVYDVDSKQYVHKADLALASVRDCSMGLWKDGRIYGITEKEVFRIDPETFQLDVVAKYPGTIRCGFAIDDRGIYFGEDVKLMRYNWPKP